MNVAEEFGFNLVPDDLRSCRQQHQLASFSLLLTSTRKDNWCQRLTNLLRNNSPSCLSLERLSENLLVHLKKITFAFHKLLRLSVTNPLSNESKILKEHLPNWSMVGELENLNQTTWLGYLGKACWKSSLGQYRMATSYSSHLLLNSPKAFCSMPTWDMEF